MFPEVPPHTEYTLTETGYSLKPILDAMVIWEKIITMVVTSEQFTMFVFLLSSFLFLNFFIYFEGYSLKPILDAMVIWEKIIKQSILKNEGYAAERKNGIARSDMIPPK